MKTIMEIFKKLKKLEIVKGQEIFPKILKIKFK